MTRAAAPGATAYEPPSIVELGTLAQLTLQSTCPGGNLTDPTQIPPQKSTGAIDGICFLGVDLAS